MYPGGDQQGGWQQPPAHPQQPIYPQQPIHPQQPIYPQQPFYGQPPPPPPSNRSHILVITGVAVVLMLIVVGFAAFMIVRSDDDDPTTADPTPGSSSIPPASPRDGLVVGSGPVKIDVYVDYQCPPCSTFEAATEADLSGYIASNRVTLAIHPVAFIDSRSKNRYSTRAAAAMACAYEGGKTLELHGHLLRNQPPEDTAGPTDDQLVATGATLGLGDSFRDCVVKGDRLAWVRDATSAAQGNGVTSVPAAFVNGSKIGTKSSDLTEAVDGAR